MVSPRTSVAVDDLHVLCVAIFPDEADAVAIVDPDAVLPASVARQRCEPIAGERGQISKLPRGVQLLELPLGHACDLLQTPAESAGEQRLRFGVLERPDHVTPKL